MSANPNLISGTTGVAGLIGYPARYSLSPSLHNAAYRALDLDLRYLVFPVRENYIEDAVRGVRALSIVGASVTHPYKDVVIPFLDEITPMAEALQSVNCITNNEGVLVGDSTDGEGFLRSVVEDAQCSFDNKRVLVIGAGGAARAVIAAIATQPVREVIVLNRTSESARVAAELGGGKGRVGTLSDVADADILINATSLGMTGQNEALSPLDGALFQARHVVIDLVYTPAETVFLRDAARVGAKTLNGLGMLLHQAARQVELWTSLKPPIAEMRAALESALV